MEAPQWWALLALAGVGGLMWLWGYAAGITRRNRILKRLDELDAETERRARPAKTSVTFTMPALKPEVEARLAEGLKAGASEAQPAGVGTPSRARPRQRARPGPGGGPRPGRGP